MPKLHFYIFFPCRFGFAVAVLKTPTLKKAVTIAMDWKGLHSVKMETHQ